MFQLSTYEQKKITKKITLADKAIATHIKISNKTRQATFEKKEKIMGYNK